MNIIGIDDFELKHLEKNPQLSEEDFEKLKMEILKCKIGISKEDRDRLTKILKEIYVYKRNKECKKNV